MHADLVTFTEEIFNGKLHFLCSNGSLNTKSKIWRRYLTLPNEESKVNNEDAETKFLVNISNTLSAILNRIFAEKFGDIPKMYLTV